MINSILVQTFGRVQDVYIMNGSSDYTIVHIRKYRIMDVPRYINRRTLSKTLYMNDTRL